MILLLLTTVILAAASSWLMTTDAYWGVRWLERLHRTAAYGALALIGVHVAGVVVNGRLHGENLVRAMITGRKPAAIV